jgi:hypothetical protein
MGNEAMARAGRKQSKPTSVRLSEEAARSLDDAVARSGVSKSVLIDLVVKRYVKNVASIVPEPTRDEKLATLARYAGVGIRDGIGRSMEEIVADVREMRGD